MFFKKKKSKDERKDEDRMAMQEYAKWTGQWNKREERRREIESDQKNIKKVGGLTEGDIINLSYDFVRIFLSLGYGLEKFPETSYGGQFRREQLAKKYNNLDKLLIFINFFPKKAISDAFNMLSPEDRGKIKKKLNIPPAMSQQEKHAVWNDFIQKYYLDEIEKMEKEKEKGNWFTGLINKIKGK